ncbi:hypothetical protein J2Z83_003202 [Virgibacillus natechei]|uniref:Uncharacterized protein n=1 Tax=Virgibacillus natechei TaxID=1216297 RepID=A0ABS4IJB8_9BACI|nr:YaaC family protein [Virgibacillus natechei]MBP1971065.1 hypothetical protein [Virgibacillus natechei]UZD13008.1 YaaC family protein [Virgibacillus natechei]
MSKKSIESIYTYLQTIKTSQLYLKNCYKDLPDIDTEKKSFENSGSFMYYLNQGKLFLKEGEKVDIRLKPILYFYGLGHLLKACLLTNRPNYPESTTILAHGVSSRKRKKKHYTFVDDEVKIQQNGLFSYTHNHLFNSTTPSFSKIKMNVLLGLIPEMEDFFAHRQEEHCVSVGKIGSTSLAFPVHLLDRYHLTQRAFLQRVGMHVPSIHTNATKDHLLVEIEKPIQHSTGPFYFHLDKQEVYFPCTRELFLPIHEIMIHYLLLYNLSMISRYETEYWAELFSTQYDMDHAIISHYLNFSVEKITFLIGEWLLQRAPFS